MSLPTYHIRPNESNPTILRTLQFLVQANMLMNKNILEDEQKKTLITKVEALVQELNKRYKLDEELNKEKDSLKRFDSLTSAFQQTFEFTENRRILEELSEEIAETKVEIQKNHSDIRYLSCSVERVKNQIKKETEKHEKRKLSAMKVNEELKKKSENIRKNLENSTAVSKLRRLEEEKRLVEKSVEELKNAEAQTLESIKIMKATLKSENKKPFVKLVVEIAKQWRSYNVLLPKLERSRKNVEKLKVEEAARRASGSLDDTIVFDNSFVKATQDNNTTLNINTSLNTSRASIPSSQTKKALIPQVVPMTTSQSTGQMNTSVRSISSNLSEQQQQQPFLPPRNVEPEQVQEQGEEESMDQSNYEVDERMNSRDTTLEQDPEPRVEEEEQEEPEIENEFEGNIQQEDSQPQSVEEIAEPQNHTINNEEEEAIEENIEEPQEVEEVHNSSVRSNSSKNASGFFDNLLAGKKTSGNGNGKKKDIADTILDISMNSVDGGSDLLKEMENRMEDDRHSQGSQVDNFSFNIFNAAGSTANSESNFDFDFGGGGGGSGGNNDNFDFFGGGDSPSKGAASGEGGAQADPFGFGKASNAENSGFSFNFDDAGSSGAGAGNSSFFNF